jgi:hypothetical protein
MPFARHAAAVVIVLGFAGSLAASPVAGTSPTPTPTSAYGYVSDRLLVRFREAPSQSELEAFASRWRLEVVAYLGAGYAPGEGWFSFRIVDGADASLRLEAILADAGVCNAARVAKSTWDAIGTEAPADDTCLPLPSPSATAQPSRSAVPAETSSPSPVGVPASPSTPSPGDRSFAVILGILALAVGGAAVLMSMLLRRQSRAS